MQTTNFGEKVCKKNKKNHHFQIFFFRVDPLLNFFAGFNPSTLIAHKSPITTKKMRRDQSGNVFNSDQLILLEWFVVKDGERGRLAPETPPNSWIAAKSAHFLNVRRQKDRCPASTGECEMYRRFLCVMLFISSDFLQDLIVHLCESVSVLMKVGGPTPSRRGGYSTSSLRVRSPRLPNVVCVGGLVLGGAAGRAGVRRGAGLLLVLGGAVGLQGRHGWRGELTLGGAAFTAEQLAFDLPEVIAIVKSEGEDTDEEVSQMYTLNASKLSLRCQCVWSSRMDRLQQPWMDGWSVVL